MTSNEVEFLQERLYLLETWLSNTPDDENNEDLIEKRDEYKGLIDETVLLQKKLRKTSKLLAKEGDKSILRKLSKKQNQYSSEIDEIMNYAESDVLFETAEIEPNELLGEPLETLVEQPGLEGSSSSLLNFSMSDFMPNALKLDYNKNLHSIAETSGLSSFGKIESTGSFSSGMESLFTISTSESNTYNYDQRTLRKKLKKVEKLLAAEELACSKGEMSEFDSIQLKKLRKKREQYTEALKIKTNKNNPVGSSKIPLHIDDTLLNDGVGVKNGIGNSQSDEDTEEEDFLKEIKEDRGRKNSKGEEGKRSHIENFHDSVISERRTNSSYGAISHDQKTLKKKLKKVQKLIAATNDPEELKKYKLKRTEYKTALETLNNEEAENVETSSSRRHAQHEIVVDEKIIAVDQDDAPPSSGRSLDSNSPKHESPEEEINQDNEEAIELLTKKLRKVVKVIAKAREEDDPKLLKKMEKKRLEYQTSLEKLGVR
eukprot:jgi/Psemu1/70476/estExt_Genemark1.C_22850002